MTAASLSVLCGPLTPPPSPLGLLDDSKSQRDVRKGLCFQAGSGPPLMGTRTMLGTENITSEGWLLRDTTLQWQQAKDSVVL